MSVMRPELRAATTPSPSEGTSYLSIYESVKRKHELIAGRLHEHGESCAIGSFFDDHPKASLSSALIDEVALVNDSFRGSHRQRRAYVLRWLRWKLAGLGMPGFKAAKKPTVTP